MSLEEDGGRHTQRPLLPSTAVGQLSFSPATQTTVVTTTTTTTTAFPPFAVKAPSDLKARDPETYPLAAISTPAWLKKVTFPLGGQLTEFEEAEDAEHKLNQYQRQQDTLRSRNGTIQTTRLRDQSSSPQRARKADVTRPGKPRTVRSTRELADLRKQSVTPLSMTDDGERSDPEAAELDSFHRRHNYQVPRAIGGLQPSLNRVRSSHGEVSGRTYDRRSNVGRTLPAPPLLRNTISSRRSPLAEELQHHASAVTVQTDRIAGSSTPPHQSSEESSECEGNTPAARPRALGSIDTSSVQDASLPSPSLSPITAAAQGRHVPQLGTRQTEDAADINETLPFQGPTNRKLTTGDSHPDHIDLAVAQDFLAGNPQLPTPSITDIPHLLDTFDVMPENLQSYVMYQLLRRCSKTTLHFVSDAIAPALKVDFFKHLPPELCSNVAIFLDAQSMCRAAQVSKRWRHVIDRDEKAWARLIVSDKLKLPAGETERAVREGWGWQFPQKGQQWEVDLGWQRSSSHEFETEPSRKDSKTARDLDAADTTSLKRKRKVDATSSSSNKKLKRRERRTSNELSEWSIREIARGHGPHAYAKLAEAAVPNPRIGLRSLRQLALHKSIYRRHHRIKHGWLEPKSQPKHLAFRAHEGHVITCLQFDKDKILTGSDDAIIDIFDTATGARRRRLTGHEGGVWALEYQDNILVSGSTDRSVRIWNMDNGKCLHVFQGHTSTVRCLQIVQPVATGKRADGKPIMHPPQRTIITGSRDSSCRIWRLPKPNDRSIFQTNPSTADDNPFFVRALTGHTHSVRAIAAYCDTLVSGSYDNTVRVWSISTGETLQTLRGHGTKVYSVVLDHERKRCISGSMDTIVKVWSIETGDCLFNLQGHTSLVGLLDLRDNILVSAAADHTLKIWNPQNGACEHTLVAHTSAITCFAHDGNKVVSGSEKSLKLWNVSTGECVRDLLMDLRGVWQVRFDERRCIAAVHRGEWTYIEVLDFGAAADGVPKKDLGRRIIVDIDGVERSSEEDEDEFDEEDAPLQEIVEIED